MTGQGDRCWIGARQLRGAKLSLEPAGGGDRVGNAEAGMQPLGGGQVPWRPGATAAEGLDD